MNLMAYEEVADLIVKWEQTVSDPKAAILPCFIMFNGTVSRDPITPLNTGSDLILCFYPAHCFDHAVLRCTDPTSGHV